jgi:hypothetical protein
MARIVNIFLLALFLFMTASCIVAVPVDGEHHEHHEEHEHH